MLLREQQQQGSWRRSGLNHAWHWHTGTMHDPSYNGDMAKKYPFKLDPFQSTAIACLVSCTAAVHALDSGHNWQLQPPRPMPVGLHSCCQRWHCTLIRLEQFAINQE